jgi:Cu+-exporting ATPase
VEESYGLQDYSDGSEEEMVRDPVCGMIVNQNHAAAKTDYAGERYYFCSTACQKQFEESPKDFLGRTA